MSCTRAEGVSRLHDQHGATYIRATCGWLRAHCMTFCKRSPLLCCQLMRHSKYMHVAYMPCHLLD